MDLLQGAVVKVSSYDTKTEPLPEMELWLWLDAMRAYDNAEDSEYYNATLLEHAPLYRLHHPPQPCVWRPYGRHHHAVLSIPKEHACDIHLDKLC